ncbi:MAG: SagB/ThcOx family dehydrogenase, partial [Chloroflexota bacterium]
MGAARTPGFRIPRRQALLAGSFGALGLLAGWIIAPGSRSAGDPEEDASRLYHRRSKSSLSGTLSGTLPGWKKGQASSQQIEPVSLPPDFSDKGMSLEDAIEQRRSIRDYPGPPLTLLDISRLLHRASGITEPQSGYRAAPSAGALYPVDLYLVVNSVEGLTPGIYLYRPRGHSLDAIREGDFRNQLSLFALGQGVVARASAVLVMAGVFQRSRQKYGERSYRYVLIECGHIAQ